MNRIIFCGSRHYSNGTAVTRAINALAFGTIVVTGGARGADRIAAEVAYNLGFTVENYPAKWHEHDWSQKSTVTCYHKVRSDGSCPAAGPRRNQQMIELDNVQAVVAFPGGRGTADMIDRARQRGVEVIDGAKYE